METTTPIAPPRAGVSPAHARHHVAPPRRATALYILVLLALVSLLGYYDRFLIAIVTQAIKSDMHVSDARISLLSGLGFAAVYSLLAVPIARLSDGGRRVRVLSLSLTVWSAMTALCGVAPSFGVLLLARLGVGVGEAGGNPTIHALVSDTFERRWRGTALSVVVVVGGCGYMAASFIGGWIVDHWGWRMAFIAGAAPGPLLALLLWLTVKEPHAAAPRAQESLWRATRVLLARRAFLLLCLGVAVCSVGSFAVLSWVPAFLMRHYHLTAARVGATYGLTMGLATIAALLFGGVLVDLLARRDMRWSLRLPALSFALASPLTLAFLYTDSLDIALAISLPMTFFAGLSTSPSYALIQSLAGSRYRATASALFLLFTYLIGMGVGPSLAGVLSDLFAASAGPDALRHALAVVSLTYIAGALLIASGSRTLLRELAMAEHD
ncbi:MFS transporter [Paraburkholderia sp. Ac-20342]|uniref:MFS transporter n=1 Tax=Paraburkholderia sp. Ac-20342 TaxID=2703889 RepID=UPI00197F1FCF|nr:MFS transporter [Paraburkholderia sp. Ac-20342]MBN3845857.1 MFS transporter [Paraburkholderia sp. Ac-20342]